MAHVNDFLCDVCGQWCSAADVPLVVYIVAGVPPDYAGSAVDLNAAGVKVPAIIRDLMMQPVPRREYCVKCFAGAMGLELVEAQQPERKPAPDLPAGPTPVSPREKL